MRQTGELALHPHELPGVLQRLLFGVLHVHADQIAEILRPRRVANLGRGLRICVPDRLGRIDRGVQRDVRIALLRRPDHRLARQHARYPHAWIRLLHRHRPGVDHALLVVRAFPAERTRRGPGLLDQVMRLDEAFAVVRGVHAVGQLLLPAAAHEARHHTALRDHVDHRDLFGELHRVLRQRQRIAEEARSSRASSPPRGSRRTCWSAPACRTARCGARSA